MIARNNFYPRVGQLEVLQSEAGFYIGRLYYFSADEANPYDRASIYYKDKGVAEQHLIDNSYIENLD